MSTKDKPTLASMFFALGLAVLLAIPQDAAAPEPRTPAPIAIPRPDPDYQPLPAPTRYPEGILAARGSRPAPTPTRAAPTPVPTQAPSPTAAERTRALGTFIVTGYSNSAHFNGTDGRGITYSGKPTRWGVVAVDPRVIPLESRLRLDGFPSTIFDALDTGGGIKGRWIDVWFPTDADAIRHGMRRLGVELLER